MNVDIPLYWNGDEYGVLISRGFGAGWSTWNDDSLAYDKRVIEFWMAHKDDEGFMRTVNDFGFGNHKESDAHRVAREFFESIGYKECPYLGGFSSLYLEWVHTYDEWRIEEYDGAEGLVLKNDESWNSYCSVSNQPMSY